MWTWFTQSMLCIMMSFTKITPKHSISHQSDQIFSYSQQWLLYLLVSVRFLQLSQSPSSKTSIKGRKRKRQVADCWSMTQLWKSPPPNQIVRLQGGEVPAPGHAVSPTSFEGLMHIFLSCQGRVMGAKEYRGAQRSLLSKYQEPLKYLIVL